jgi:hypothetical protein
MCQHFKNCRNPGVDLDLPGSPGLQANLCKEHYRALWEDSLVSEHADKLQTVPLDHLVGATEWSVILVAIQNDPAYLSKSLVYTAYRPASTATPLRLLRNRVARTIIKKSSGMSEAEFKEAKRKTPKDSDDNPTMGHTYVILQALSGKTAKALYSFGYFPLALGVVNPDRHVRLSQEQRRSLNYLVTKAQWDSALDEVFKWRWDHVTKAVAYNLMGRNCTEFARAVVKAAGGKFLGDTIMTLTTAGVGRAYTPNRTFQALGAKNRHQQWDTGTGSAVHIGAASAAELHNQFFDFEDV